MPLDHIGYYVPASLLEPEVRFILASLAHLNFAEFKRPHPSVVGLGPPHDPCLWVAAAEAAPGVSSTSSPDSPSAAASAAAASAAAAAGTTPHVAVKASSRAEVDAFHEAALKAGGQDNGKPGDRTEYHAGYYAAFVRSPAGCNLEVVFHDMEAMKG